MGDPLPMMCASSGRRPNWRPLLNQMREPRCRYMPHEVDPQPPTPAIAIPATQLRFVPTAGTARPATRRRDGHPYPPGGRPVRNIISAPLTTGTRARGLDQYSAKVQQPVRTDGDWEARPGT